MSWHLDRFFGWDLETTAPDPTEARVVTATIITVDGDGLKDQREWLVDPGVEIPAEAAAIHGVTTEHARAAGDDAATACLEIMTALYRAWDDGAPVVIYNASYDCTVLDRELRRHHGFGFDVRGPIIDPYTIDKALDRYRRGSRTLTAACAVYGVRMDGAHDATQDTLAACRVAWKLAQKYPEHLADLATINARQAAWRAEQAASFADYLRRKGEDASEVSGEWPIRPLVAAVAS